MLVPFTDATAREFWQLQRLVRPVHVGLVLLRRVNEFG